MGLGLIKGFVQVRGTCLDYGHLVEVERGVQDHGHPCEGKEGDDERIVIGRLLSIDRL